uniref:C3H1-type domain-containing protein n=1 Tax=Neobodo designis TaxID=312471 RepID=A0A7S1LGK0_NEODS|mmetsp:Transcript_2140/g.6658  ORF Transcript_2140/g.6658 Transcript_2140/m.6658 type:complete len:263 (+) Transcript_2140:202-990(+)
MAHFSVTTPNHSFTSGPSRDLHLLAAAPTPTANASNKKPTSRLSPDPGQRRFPDGTTVTLVANHARFQVQPASELQVQVPSGHLLHTRADITAPIRLCDHFEIHRTCNRHHKCRFAHYVGDRHGARLPLPLPLRPAPFVAASHETGITPRSQEESPHAFGSDSFSPAQPQLPSAIPRLAPPLFAATTVGTPPQDARHHHPRHHSELQGPHNLQSMRSASGFLPTSADPSASTDAAARQVVVTPAGWRHVAYHARPKQTPSPE